jgi:iron complex transport system permease protein
MKSLKETIQALNSSNLKEEASFLTESTPLSTLKELYKKTLFKKALFGILLLIFLFLAGCISLLVGSGVFNPFTLFFSQGEYSGLIFKLRMVRIGSAIVAGASLGLTGAIMQTVLRNPLASPFTLGISHGAAFGASFAIIVLGAGKFHASITAGLSISSYFLVVLFAFLFAFLGTLLILFLSFVRNLKPEAIILSGVALGSLFTSATMILQYFGEDFQVAATLFWTFGDLGKAGLQELKIMGFFLLILFPFCLFLSWKLNALLWGDEIAQSLGIEVKKLRLISLLISAFLVSVCTSFLGIIGFIGLISPHIVRLLIGNDHRFLLPYSALTGALLLTLSDLLSRIILSPHTLPVGVITTFLGAPLFFILLIRKNRSF